MVDFWNRVDASGDCWEWRGSINRDGYGQVHFDGRTHMTHRVAWTLLVGEIPDGLWMDHLCRHRLCVNPDHLEPVTRAVNILRGYSFSAQNARRTRCRLGHPLDYENQGHRKCRTCKNASGARWRARQREGSKGVIGEAVRRG